MLLAQSLLLAQGIPVPDPKMLEGSVQQILVWVILTILGLWISSVVYLLRQGNAKDEKYDILQQKCIKLAVRSQRAIEALANLPPPEVEEDLDDKPKES